jgi:hypothetical protein
VAERGAAEIAHQHWRAIDLRDHGRADIAETLDQARAADDVALISARKRWRCCC